MKEYFAHHFESAKSQRESAMHIAGRFMSAHNAEMWVGVSRTELSDFVDSEKVQRFELSFADPVKVVSAQIPDGSYLIIGVDKSIDPKHYAVLSDYKVLPVSEFLNP